MYDRRWLYLCACMHISCRCLCMSVLAFGFPHPTIQATKPLCQTDRSLLISSVTTVSLDRRDGCFKSDNRISVKPIVVCQRRIHRRREGGRIRVIYVQCFIILILPYFRCSQCISEDTSAQNRSQDWCNWYDSRVNNAAGQRYRVKHKLSPEQ